MLQDSDKHSLPAGPSQQPSGQHYQLIDLLLWLWHVELDVGVQQELEAQVVGRAVQLVSLQEKGALRKAAFPSVTLTAAPSPAWQLNKPAAPALPRNQIHEPRQGTLLPPRNQIHEPSQGTLLPPKPFQK